MHLHPGASATQEELTEFARGRLASYKVPSQVFISEQPLPRNATNKILKRELKEALLAAG